MIRKLFFGAIAALIPVASFAVYNTNGSFVVIAVATYTDTDSIYFNVAAPPAVSGCSNSYFVVSGAYPADRRKAILAQLLVAKNTGLPIQIGYDSQAGDCAEGYVRVHRVG
jgi:hypothetical protein